MLARCWHYCEIENMNMEKIKNKRLYIPRTLLAFSGLLGLLIVAKVSAFVMTTGQIPANIEKTLKSPSQVEDNVKKYQSIYSEAAGEMKKKNMFMPPTAAKKNPVTTVTAIFGDEVYISNKWYKVGDKIQDAEITGITSSQVTVVWNGKETRLHPFDSMAVVAAPSTDSGSKKDKYKKHKEEKIAEMEQRPEPQPMQMGQGNGMRRPMLSDEERQKRIQEYMKNLTPEQRAQFEERRRSRGNGGGGPRGSGGGGPRRGGGDSGGGGRGRGGR